MARRSSNADLTYAWIQRTPVTAAPLTMAIWVKPVGDALTDRWAMSIKDESSSATGDHFALRRLSSGVYAFGAARASGSTSDGAAAADNTWAAVIGVAASTTSRTVYVNGVAGTTDTVSRVPINLDSVAVGHNLGASAIYRPITGLLHWPAIWDVALNADEIALFSAGVSPRKIRPQNLVFWIDEMDQRQILLDKARDYHITNLTPNLYVPELPPQVLARNPERTARIYAFPSGAGSLNVSATTDALTLAEYAATIGKSINVSANVDALTLAEYAATIGSATNVSATTDALTLAEYPATIGLSLNIAANTDALTLAEYPASLGSTTNVAATTDALTLAEYPATLSFALNVQATCDVLSLAEYRATVENGTVTTTVTPAGGGSGAKRKKYPKRVYINGRAYTVKSEAEEKRLLEQWRQSIEDQAAITENLGETDLAQTIRKKAVRIAARVEAVNGDLYAKLRDEDEEILALLLAA